MSTSTRTLWPNTTWDEYRDLIALPLSILPTTGQVFYVGPGGVDGAGYGSVSKKPFATVDYAVGKCIANHGDLIVVMEGHNESITSATSLVIDVAGVKIIGLGEGSSRPTFDFDNTAGSIEMDAASCLLKNLIFRASVASCAVAVNVDADHCTIEDCFWTFESTGDEFILCVDVDTVNYTTIKNCYITTETAAGASTHGIRLDTADYTRITDCVVEGTFSAGALVVEGAACTELLVLNNVFHNTAEPTVIILAASTGTFHNNVIFGAGGAVANVFTYGNCQCGRNWVCDVVANRGTQLIPDTSSA